jgi:CBS domain-containing protein
MTRDVAVVHPETSLLAAVKLMVRRHISGMPVVDDAGSILGMVSEGDLVRWHDPSRSLAEHGGVAVEHVDRRARRGAGRAVIVEEVERLRWRI